VTVQSACPQLDTSLFWDMEQARVHYDLRIFRPIPQDKAVLTRIYWLSRYLQRDPSYTTRVWFGDITNEDTDTTSLFKNEMDALPYYKCLRVELSKRCYFNDKVLVIGATSGAEVEVIRNLSFSPMVFAADNSIGRVMEERLLNDLIGFESLSYKDVVSPVYRSHFAVMSPYIVEGAEELIRFAYNLLGSYGWIVFPRLNLGLAKACKSLKMLYRGTGPAAVYFKHPGQPDVV
jgi:hypothetical protein